MMALRYGTVPIVRATGGLADSIVGFSAARSETANGFAFEQYTPEALLQCVTEAVAVYRDRAVWRSLVARRNDLRLFVEALRVPVRGALPGCGRRPFCGTVAACTRAPRERMTHDPGVSARAIARCRDG